MSDLFLKSLPFAPEVGKRRLEALLGRSRHELERIASNAGRFYEPFDRRNRETDKWRHIDNPSQELKLIQSAFHRGAQPLYEFRAQVLGGIKGVSVLRNLELHVRPEVLVALDLRRCFPSISHRDVYDALRHSLHFSGEVANLVTRLTTFQGRLPQGAPSSSLLANLVLIPLHSEIAQIARFYQLSWSIWVDDITLSGKRAEDAVDLVIAAIHRHGHTVSREKIRVAPNSTSQHVTGGYLNRKISAGRDRISSIREEILALADSPRVFTDQLRSVWGKINHVKFLNAAQGQVLTRFARMRLPVDADDRPRVRRDLVRPCQSFSKCTREGITPKAGSSLPLPKARGPITSKQQSSLL